MEKQESSNSRSRANPEYNKFVPKHTTMKLQNSKDRESEKQEERTTKITYLLLWFIPGWPLPEPHELGRRACGRRRDDGDTIAGLVLGGDWFQEVRGMTWKGDSLSQVPLYFLAATM